MQDGGAVGYCIYRKTVGGKYSLVKKIVGRDTTKWVDTSTANLKEIYTYCIKAYTRSGGKVVYTKASAAKTVVPAPVLKSAACAGYNSVKVTWNPVSGASSYTLYCKGGSVKSWKKVKSGITGTSYVHSSLTAGTTYTYTVRASYGKTLGSYDKTGKSAKPVPATVKLGKVTSAGSGKLKITWSKVTGATGYVVYQKIGGSWKKLKVTKGTSFTHSNSKAFPVKRGKTNTYTVRAYRTVNKKNIYGGYSKTGISGKAK